MKALEATGGLSPGYSDRIVRDMDTAGDAIVQDAKTRYGPLLRGDFDEFGNQVAQHPGLFALDVASVFSGVGAGVRAGSRGALSSGLVREGGLTSRLAERSVLPAGQSVPGGRVSTGDRYRSPRVVEQRLGENTNIGGTPATLRLEVPRRPYSANPLTRGVQKKITGPAGQTFSRFLEEQGNASRSGSGRAGAVLARPFSTTSRFNRVAAKAGRDMRYAAELERASALREGSKEFMDASRDVIKEYGDEGAAAIRMHAQDLLDVDGLTPAGAVKAIADFMHEGLDAAVREHGVKSRGAARVQRAIEQIPGELQVLDDAPASLQRAVQAARELSTRATEMRIQAGTITPETAAAVASRAAEQVHGGSRYSARQIRETPKVVAARGRLEAAITARDAGPRLTPLRALRRGFTAGRRTGRGDRNVELSAPLRGSRRIPIIGRPGDTGPAFASVPRGPGISASRSRAYGQVIGGRARQASVRIGMQESGKLAREVRDARHAVSVAEREARGGFTPPSRTDVGRRGVYWPDSPVDRLPTRSAGQPHGAFGRLTQDKVHESHGTLFGMGNTSMDPRSLVQALDRALVDEMHPGFVRTMVDTFAFKGPDGLVATGDKAISAMRADPDHVVLASRKGLEDAMRLAQELPEGVMPDDPFRGVNLHEGTQGLALAETEAKAVGDFVALPKAAVEAVRTGYKDPTRIAIYDTPLQLWRRGILAFTPRWYLNNLFGNTFQFGLLSGGDWRAIGQARMDRLGSAVPEQISSSTVVNDVRMTDPLAEKLPRPRGV